MMEDRNHRDFTEAIEWYVNDYFENERQLIELEPARSTCVADFQPQEGALLGPPLWKTDVKVPKRESVISRQQKGFLGRTRPNLLLYDLHNTSTEEEPSQPSAFEHIDDSRRVMPTCLYGTSGAGKTRTVYEYLCRHKGFYLLASDFQRNLGSRDLYDIFAHTLFGQINLDQDSKETIESKDKTNRGKVEDGISAAILCRYVVHKKLTEIRGRELTPYEWLLYQLFPTELLGNDLFRHALSEALRNSRSQIIRMSLDVYAGATIRTASWPVFVDEAQALLKIGHDHFVSQEKTQRSAFSALVQGLGTLANDNNIIDHAVFSGTGLAFEQPSKEISSIVGKLPGEYDADAFFADFQQLDVEGVKNYIGNFVDLSDVSSEVIMHVANWLRGRPRWTASFLEVYVSRQEKASYETTEWKTQGSFEKPNDLKLIQALDRYLNVMTRPDESKGSQRESWSAGSSSAYACFTRVETNLRTDSETSEIEVRNQIKSDLEYAVCRFAIGEDPWIFRNARSSIFLIKQGVVAVRGTGGTKELMKGYLDEPIVVEAGLNFFDLESRLQKDFQESLPDAYGKAFERLLLPGLMMKKGEMNKFLQNNIDNSKPLEGFDAPRKSANGVVCVVADNDINKTINWVSQSVNAKFEGQVPPYCYPDEQIGPDLMYLLRFQSNYSLFHTVVIQSKYVSVVSNQQEALRTLRPESFYAEQRGTKKETMSKQLTNDNATEWNKWKDKLISDDKPCVRILVQMPAEPSSSAVSGMVAADATSPTGKSNMKKRDWMVIVKGDNAGEVFSDTSISLIHLLKEAKPRKSRRIHDR